MKKIAIVGGTGAVGKTLLDLIVQRNFPYEFIDIVASPRSEGKKIRFAGEELTVKNLHTYDFSNIDMAFFSAGTPISREWVPKAVSQGALVIDNTNAFRMTDGIPLVVPQVNGYILADCKAPGIIANPNCSTIQMVRILKPVDELYGINQVVVSTYQAASGGGLTGMEELKEDTRQLLSGDFKNEFRAKKFPKPLGFNVVPQIDVFLDNGFTLEEEKMLNESRKIMEKSDLKLTATAVRVPVLNGHSEAVYIECSKLVDRAEVIRTLWEAEEIKVYDDMRENGVCTPRFNDYPDFVHVGRIRVNPLNPNGLWLWIVADNLLIGAALNAIQIAEKIIKS